MSEPLDPVCNASDALAQLSDAFEALLAGKPVRNADEALSAAKAAMKKLTAYAPPTIVVELSGGTVENVRSNEIARVILLDTDIEGATEDTVLDVGGTDMWVQDYKLTGVDAEFVADVVADVDRPPAPKQKPMKNG